MDVKIVLLGKGLPISCAIFFLFLVSESQVPGCFLRPSGCNGVSKTWLQ